MKTHLFIAGAVVTYVTICFAIMHKWVKNLEPELTTEEAILLGVSLEQMRNGDVVDL